MSFYSQLGEDAFLNETYFKNKKNGTYIELGALDGNKYSNTRFFEDTLQWCGILIEPNPTMYKYLETNRPNNFLFNDLVSCHTENLKFKYYDNGDHTAVSGVENTLSQYHLDNWFNCHADFQNTMTIKPKTLTEIITGTPVSHIDFLSLDVEGHEYEVLTSWDFSIPIDLILIEILGVDKIKEDLCREILHKNNYIFMETFQHNEIYVLANSPYNFR